MLPGKKLGAADILQMLRRRWWLVLLPPMVTTFAALILSSTVPNLYQSDMLIAIDPQRVPDSFVRSTVTLATDQRLNAIAVQVLSRSTLENVIQEFDLYPEERETMAMDDVIAMMRSRIQVPMDRPRPQGNGNVAPSAFHVQFTHTNPEIAATVTQLLGSKFVDQNSQDRTRLAESTNRFLDTQLVDARRELEIQEKRLEAFRERHGKELPTQMQTNMQALASTQLQVQSLVESIARDKDRKLMLERLYREASNEPPAPAAPRAASAEGTPAAGGTAQQQLAAARATLADLQLRYKDDHPDVRRAQRRVAELEPRAAAEAAALAAATTTPGGSGELASVTDPARRESLRQMRAEIESLDRQVAFKESEEGRVRGEIAEYQRRIEAVPGLESEWVALTRDYDTKQAAYKELLTKSSAAEVAANLESQEIGERFRIVDPAVVPVRPLPSMRIRYNAGGFLLGLLLGVGIAALLEFKDASFRSETDVFDILGIPVLATVPRVPTSMEADHQQRRHLWLGLAGGACVIVAGYVTWSLKLWNSLI